MKASFRRDLLLCDSPNPTERESVRLGTLLADNSPLLVHKKCINEHFYIKGAPGSGKSATLAYLSELFLSQGGCREYFFDLKDQSDMALFTGMRIGARRSGTRVRWFTDQVGKSTHTYVLFKQEFFHRQTPMQRAGLVSASLGTSHGLAGYGSQWFGGAAFELLLIVFERFAVASWTELLENIKLVRSRPRDYGVDREMVKAAGQLVLDVGRLTRIAPLNTPWSSIDLSSDEPEAIYWDFSGLYDMAGVVSRLVLFSIFAAASNIEKRPPTWVFIDEFQRCLGNNMELLFQQSREKIGLILANQCLADLNIGGKDYASTVKTCCRIHWTFNASDEAQQLFMSDMSGKVIRKFKTTAYMRSAKGSSKTVSFQEAETNRLGMNEISLTSSLPELSLFRCTQDFGFVQYGGFPQVIFREYHIDPEEYARRKLTPWPDGEDGTINGEMPSPIGPLTPPAPRGLPAPDIINPQRKTRRRHP